MVDLVMPLHIETPLIKSNPLSARTGQDVWLKLESLQPSGSFKIRGIGLACQTYVRRGARRFISSSGGNAGIAVAYAGRQLSRPVVVVVPETTTARAKSLIRREGAEVIVHGSSWQEANELALEMVTAADAFIHPFDDPLLWHGHASIIAEVASAGLKPDAVLLSVGGGGLLCGIIEGLHRHDWRAVPIITVETEGADSFARSIAAGSRIELPAITSLATSLGARQVCQQAFDWREKHPIRSIVISDHASVKACQRFLLDHQILVEPACGAALVPVYEGASELEHYRSILVIVCGGVTVTVEQLQAWSRAFT